MSIDERTIQKKLQYLLRYAAKLKKLKRYTLEEISEDLEKTWAIERKEILFYIYPAFRMWTFPLLTRSS